MTAGISEDAEETQHSFHGLYCIESPSTSLPVGLFLSYVLSFHYIAHMCHSPTISTITYPWVSRGCKYIYSTAVAALMREKPSV